MNGDCCDGLPGLQLTEHCCTSTDGLDAPDNGSMLRATMMRHGNRVKHLGRPDDQRKALVRGLVTELIRHGQIRTTKVRGPSLCPEPRREVVQIHEQA